MLAERVWEEFLAEASKENSPIQGLVNAELLISVREHHQALQTASVAGQGNLLPPPPIFVLGRTEDLWKAKRALGVGVQDEAEAGSRSASPPKKVAAVHGWPGVGKSTFVAVLCWDGEVLEHFPGGVLFVPVGRSPEVRRLAEEVCAALGARAAWHDARRNAGPHRGGTLAAVGTRRLRRRLGGA
ncbi:MAG: hypothetical protein H0X71_02015 [Rubrobacter sp.]|nr:hypothetical protein [Rubrobacter sp.]